MEIAVWAPRAKTIELQVQGRRFPMEGPDAEAWWRAEAEFAAPGADYGFVVDHTEKAYPDPRSQWQPNGVHGLSRVYDHAAFPWKHAEFRPPPLANAIIYELHVGTFTPEGTLDAAIGKHEYLRELGITHVELMPVAAFAGHHGWGYDGVALYAVHEPYGGPDALKRFVDAAHGFGLAVLLDVVYNHFGPVGNYTGIFAPYLDDAHKTPWGGAVNLEAAWSNQVRRFFCDNALMWMRDFHIDGLRLDAVHAFVDRSAIHFLEQLATETRALEAALGRHLVLIAESDLNDPRLVTDQAAGGFGLDAQWSDEFHHALFAVLARLPQTGYCTDFGGIGQLKKALQSTFVYDGIYSRYRQRVHGRPASHLPQSRFLGYIQNHDQVGNRALGDRVHVCAGIARAKIAAALVLTSPFIPMIFQGEEWAASTPFLYFADHDDEEIAKLVSEGRKKEFAAFGWDTKSIPDPEKPETFLRSRLIWDESAQGDHASMLRWYKDLIRLRRSSPSLNSAPPGSVRVTCDAEKKCLGMTRGAITVLCNLGEEPHVFDVPSGSFVLLASGAEIEEAGRQIRLQPDSVAILELPATMVAA
ncbi:MAG: malto-oligosyltrehalose trehalohydrolase [Terracidiphilus sp.]